MEIIRTEKTIVEEVITYKAADGTIFNDQEECKKYEKSAEGVMKARYKECLLYEFGDYGLNDEDWHYYDLVRAKNEDDIRAINMYMKNNYYDCSFLDTSYIGKDILLQMTDDSDYIIPIGTIDDYLDRVRRNYDKAMQKGEK